MDRCGEDVKLAEEASGEGDADQREEEEGEDRGEDGALEGEAGEVVEGAEFFVEAGELGEDDEGSDVCGGVGGGVEAGGGDGFVLRGGKGDEEVAGVGDGGVGEEALHVGLQEGAEVADGHRGYGEDGDHEHPVVAVHGGGAEEEAEEDGEGGGLGGCRHEGDYGGGGALVDVGGPDVEGGSGDFEAEADEDHRYS